MVAVEHRRVGRTDLIVPRVALGCAAFGGFGSDPQFFGRGLAEREAAALMDAAWAIGVTHFDTADAYGGGRSERMIGRWIESRGVRPVLTTKTFHPLYAGGSRGLAPARIAHHLELSLERLGLDEVDLYLAHDFDPVVPLTDSLAAFEAAQESGRIRAYGVSNFSAAQLVDALAVGSPVALENRHSLLAREDERYVLPLCAERGVAYLACSPLAGGWLASRYRRGEPLPRESRPGLPASLRAALLGTATAEAVDDVGAAAVDAVDDLRALARERGTSTAALALGWLLEDERIAQIVIGPTRPEHLVAVGEALTHPLSGEERARLDRVFGPLVPAGRSSR